VGTQDKNTKEKILELLKYLANETSLHHSKGYVEQIKKMLGNLAIYEARGKFDCHQALDFLKAVEESFSALESDLDATRGRLDVNDSRQNVLLILAARMDRYVGEMKEAYVFINEINRF